MNKLNEDCPMDHIIEVDHTQNSVLGKACVEVQCTPSSVVTAGSTTRMLWLKIKRALETLKENVSEMLDSLFILFRDELKPNTDYTKAISHLVEFDDEVNVIVCDNGEEYVYVESYRIRTNFFSNWINLKDGEVVRRSRGAMSVTSLTNEENTYNITEEKLVLVSHKKDIENWGEKASKQDYASAISNTISLEDGENNILVVDESYQNGEHFDREFVLVSKDNDGTCRWLHFIDGQVVVTGPNPVAGQMATDEKYGAQYAILRTERRMLSTDELIAECDDKIISVMHMLGLYGDDGPTYILVRGSVCYRSHRKHYPEFNDWLTKWTSYADGIDFYTKHNEDAGKLHIGQSAYELRNGQLVYSSPIIFIGKEHTAKQSSVNSVKEVVDDIQDTLGDHDDGRGAQTLFGSLGYDNKNTVHEKLDGILKNVTDKCAIQGDNVAATNTAIYEDVHHLAGIVDANFDGYAYTLQQIIGIEN